MRSDLLLATVQFGRARTPGHGISNVCNALDSGRTGERGGGQHPAITGPWRSDQNLPCSPALDDWFTGANLNSALARPGQNRPLVIRSEFPLRARLG